MTAGQKYIRATSEPPPPWTERHDSAVRTLHPTLAAQKLGVSVKVIEARRKQLKLPPLADQFTVSGGKGGYPGWTEEQSSTQLLPCRASHYNARFRAAPSRGGDSMDSAEDP